MMSATPDYCRKRAIERSGAGIVRSYRVTIKAAVFIYSASKVWPVGPKIPIDLGITFAPDLWSDRRSSDGTEKQVFSGQ
jgi:hypothetical protein